MSDNQILRMRRARNMTQSRLAEACGVSVRTVRRAEQGMPLSDETVLALCAVFGCASGELAADRDDAASSPDPANPGTDWGRLFGATALGLVLSALVFLATFDVAYMILRAKAEHVPESDPGMRRLCTVLLCLLYGTAIGVTGLLVPLAAATHPRVREWLDRCHLTGPYAKGVSAASLSAFPGAIAAFRIGEGDLVQATVPILASGAMASCMAMASVLGHHVDKEDLFRFLSSTVPATFSVAVLVELLGLATDNTAAGALGPLLLFVAATPCLRGRSEWLAVSIFVVAGVPLMLQPYVGILLGASQGILDVLTVTACAMADAVVAYVVWGKGLTPHRPQAA